MGIFLSTKIYESYKQAVWEALSLNFILENPWFFLMCLIFYIHVLYFSLLAFKAFDGVIFSSKALCAHFFWKKAFMCMLGHVLIKMCVWDFETQLDILKSAWPSPSLDYIMYWKQHTYIKKNICLLKTKTMESRYVWIHLTL